jgi:ABC-type Mn2+/Zn2+ transport system permease subunit
MFRGAGVLMVLPQMCLQVVFARKAILTGSITFALRTAELWLIWVVASVVVSVQICTTREMGCTSFDYTMPCFRPNQYFSQRDIQ